MGLRPGSEQIPFCFLRYPRLCSQKGSEAVAVASILENNAKKRKKLKRKGKLCSLHLVTKQTPVVQHY